MEWKLFLTEQVKLLLPIGFSGKAGIGELQGVLLKWCGQKPSCSGFGTELEKKWREIL
jgi:hypothetical protein